MPNTLIDAIQLNVRSSANLSGLNAAEKKLQSIAGALAKVNNLLHGLTDATKFERSLVGVERMIKNMSAAGTATKRNIAKELGIDDPRKLEAAIQKAEKIREAAISRARGGARTKLQEELRGFQGAFKMEGSQEVVKNAKQAARVIYEAVGHMAKVPVSVANKIDLILGAHGSRTTRTEPLAGGNATITVSPAQLHAELSTGNIPLLIPSERVIATLGPGAITMVLPGGTQGATGAGAAASTSASSGETSTTNPADFSEGGTLIRSKRIVTKSGKDRWVRTFQLADREVDRYFKQVGENLEQTKEVFRSSPQKTMTDAMKRQMQLNKALGESAARGQDEIQQAIRDQMRDKAKVNKALESARKRGDTAAARQLTEEKRQIEQEIKDKNKLLASRSKAETERAKAAQDVAAFDRKQARLAAIQEMQNISHATARDLLAQKEAEGYRFSKQTTYGMVKGVQKRTERYVGEKEEGGQKFRTSIDMSFTGDKAAGAKVVELARALKATRGEASAAGRDFIKNTIHVTTWAASVGILYGSLGLLKSSIKSVVDTGLQMARLDQVFRGVGGTTRQVTNDVLELAAANGRSGSEAMEAAIQWSRLGLSRIEVNEAVKVSLMAANVAEMTAAESTEHLSGIMMAYRMNVFQLATVLAELNSISNHFNVTNKDMLIGIGKTAAIAKQAGLPLTELMGIIGATVGSTGQTGANIGNAVKSLTVGLSNPALQKLLREEFKIEVSTGGGGEVKNLSEILGELFIKYQAMTKAEQQHFLVAEAGKTQASRVAAILDNYIQSQALAIQAQLDLSSAESENTKIKASLKSQLQGLVTEWERFANIQGNRGFAQGLGGITEAFHNLLKVANAPGFNWLTTIFLGTITAVGARLAITATKFRSAADSGNLFSRSGDRLRSIWSATLETMDQVIAKSGRFTQAVDRFAQRRFTGGSTLFENARQNEAEILARKKFDLGGTMQLRGLAIFQRGLGGLQMITGTVTRSLSLLMASLRTLGPALLVIAGVTWGINRAMNAFGFSSDTAQKKIAAMTTEAEKFGAAAEAAEQRARLFLTIGRAYANTINQEAGGKMLQQVVPLAYPEEIGRKSKPKTDALEAELQLYHRLHNATAIQSRLEQVRADALQEGANDRQAKFEKIHQAMTFRGEEIDRLKNSPFNHASAIAELEKQQNESKREAIQLWDEENNAADQFLASNIKYLSLLEAQKKALTSLAAVYQDLPSVGNFGQGENEISGAKAALEKNSRQEADLKNRQNEITQQSIENERASTEAKRLEAKYRALAEQVDPERMRPAAMSIGEGNPLEEPTFYPRDPRALALQAKAEDQLRRQQKLQAEAAKLSTAATIPKKLLEKNEEEATSLKTQIAGLEEERKNRQLRDRFTLAGQMAGYRATESDVGETEGEKALNRRKGLLADIASLQEQFQAAAGNGARQDILRVQIASQLVAVEHANLDIVRQRSELRQKETQRAIDLNRELQRTLLVGGPEELLKNLAAFQLTGGKQGKLGMGQFLGLSPEIKKAVSVYDTRYDPETREIKQAQRRLGPDQSFDQVNAERERIAKAIAEINAQIQPMGSNLGIAAQSARDLASAAANAALYLMRLSELPGIIDGIANAAKGLFRGGVGMSYDAGSMPAQAGGILGGGMPSAVPH